LVAKKKLMSSESLDTMVLEAARATSFSEPPFYDCFLTDGKSVGVWLGGGGSGASWPAVPAEAMVFRVVPTGEEEAEMKLGFTTVRIEHRSSDGQRLYLSDIDDVKPRFLPRDGDIGADSPSSSNTSSAVETNTAVTNGKAEVSERKSRIGFVARFTGLEALVVRPVASAEDEALDAVMNYIEPVNLYGEKSVTTVERNSTDDT
jgi:hypothetical protein